MIVFLKRMSLICLSLTTVLLIRVGLYFFRFDRIRKMMVQPVVGDPERAAKLLRILEAIRFASAIVPKATCMTQAIAGQAIASWFGIPTRLHLGAQKTQAGTVNFHAWLVWREQVVLGGEDVVIDDFNSLTFFASAT